MNGQIMEPKKLWAWALTGKDVDKDLERSVSHFCRRFGERPLLVYCPKDVKPKPLTGLEVESHPFGSAVLYFVVKGKET